MPATGFTVFDTPIGACGVAWSARGIAGVQLPEARESATRTRMKKRFPQAEEGAPPRHVAGAIREIRALLSGKTADLSGIALDTADVSPFYLRVYEAARAIPAGRTRSYGEIVTAIGSPSSARAVGQTLERNPFPIVVPCHRVMAAGGKTGGFTAEGGTKTKLRMLALEGCDTATNGASRAARPPKRTTSVRETVPSAAFDLRRAVRELRAADPVLARVIDIVGPCRLELKSAQSMFAALSEAIVYQQLTGKAAATIHGRVCALFPKSRRGLTPQLILGASDEALRGAGLSRAKVAALRD